MPAILFACPVRATAIHFVLASTLVLSGCEWLVTAPEARARELLEVLILDPDNRPRHIRAANVSDEQQLAALYSTEIDIELTYLRARARQGASVDVGIKKVERLAADRRRVQLDIAVSRPRAGLDIRGTKPDVTRIDVVLVRDAEQWRVREIRPVD